MAGLTDRLGLNLVQQKALFRLRARLTALAERERVGQSELVRYLLDFALREIEEGRHQLPAEPVDRRTLNA